MEVLSVRNRLTMLTALVLALTLFVSSCAMALASTTLYNGLSGDAVTALQQQLITLGYLKGSADGKFGNATENAVRAFQKAQGLKVDGQAGLATQELLAKLTGTELAVNSQGTASTTTTTETAASTTTTTASSTTTATATTSSGSWFAGDYTTIEYGQSGTRVQLLQLALTAAGCSPGRADSKFGAATLTAVKKFQSAYGLTVDGKAGKKTLQKLESVLAADGSAASGTTVSAATTTTSTTTASGYTIPTRTLRSGYSGSDVTSVQQRLTELGYYSSTVGTSYNAFTIAAVKAFQTANGLTADGIAGTKTNAVLFSSSAKAASSASTSSSSSDTSSSAESATPVLTATLRSGSQGSQVTLLQQALKELGYTVTVNGSYDSTTVAAVKAFQTNNLLSVDGVAGPKTLAKLYGSSAVSVSEATAAAASSSSSSSSTSSSASSSVTSTTAKGNNGATIQLLHWYNDVKTSISNGQTLLVYDPSSGKSWSLKVISRGHHADCEPLTATDTANMLAAFGGKNTWTQKAVYVKLPDGRWTLASTHDMPHLTGSITDNNFNGHLCVHFFRDMSECKANDPNYGVSNQNTIRSAWKALTGETIN